MRVTAELGELEQRPDIEAVDDLADAVAVGVGQAADLVETAAGQILRDQHPGGAQLEQRAGHHDERMVGVELGQLGLGLRLGAVVEFAFDVEA
ncbi:Uncharacterised protein [Mycobacteroides abscessus subsp. abscessus]|nr:Uncharacterised protein [Mycobacteroides abscessus subsp. abscessus]